MALSKAKNFKNFISLWFCYVNSAIHTRLCFLFQLYRLQVIFYLLLFVICLFVAVIYLFTRNTSTICEMSSNLVKTVLAFLIFLFTWSQFHFAFLYFLLNTNWWMLIDYQKQPSIGVLTKSCSENVQQMYRRTTV